MKFQVRNGFNNYDQFIGEEPRSEIRMDCVDEDIDADTPEEAIEIAINFLAEQCDTERYYAEVTEYSTIVFYDVETDEFVSEYYDFTATPVDD